MSGTQAGEGSESRAPAPFRLAVIGDGGSCHVINRTIPFQRLGCDVVLITERPPAAAPFETVDVTPAPTMFLRLVAFFWNYVRALRRARPDGVLAHYAQSQGGWAAAYADRRPLIVSAMGGDVLFDEQGAPPLTARWLTRELLRQADAVVAVSHYLAAKAAALGVEPSRLRRVVWMVDRTRFRPLDRAAARIRFGLPAEGPAALYPKSLEPFYNAHVMVEAAPAILARRPDVNFIFTEQFADRSYGDRLRARLAALGIADRAFFVGAVDNADMPALYACADVAVALPPSDGMPMSMLEAMACGVPNVMADVPNVREAAQNDVNALLVPIEPAAVAAAVLRLLEEPETAARIVGGGFATLDALPSLEEDAASVLALMRTLRAAPRRRTSAWRRLLIFQAVCEWHLEHSWNGNRYFSRPPSSLDDFDRLQPLWLVDIALRFLRRPWPKWRERFLDPLFRPRSGPPPSQR